MPFWKVPDEQVATELRTRLGEETSVYVGSTSAALDGSDAVILAPTAYKGVTMLITARRRTSAPVYGSAAVVDDSMQNIALENTTSAPSEFPTAEETASFDAPLFVDDQPPVPEPTSADAAFTETKASIYEPPVIAEAVGSISPEVADEPEEEFFGPTTWERIDNPEGEVNFPVHSGLPAPSEREELTTATADLTGVPSLPEPSPVETRVNTAPEAVLPPTPKITPERHYVATGFLGLDETVEDEEDLAREKRPWWKKLFID